MQAIRDWTARYGVPPTLLDWNPSLARRAGREELAELFELERPAWPTQSAVRAHFGSFGAALQAAGVRSTQSGLKRSAPHPRVI